MSTSILHPTRDLRGYAPNIAQRDIIEETVDDYRLAWPGRQFEGYKNYLREKTYELLYSEVSLDGERDAMVRVMKNIKVKRERVNTLLDGLKDEKFGLASKLYYGKRLPSSARNHHAGIQQQNRAIAVEMSSLENHTLSHALKPKSLVAGEGSPLDRPDYYAGAFQYASYDPSLRLNELREELVIAKKLSRSFEQEQTGLKKQASGLKREKRKIRKGEAMAQMELDAERYEQEGVARCLEGVGLEHRGAVELVKGLEGQIAGYTTFLEALRKEEANILQWGPGNPKVTKSLVKKEKGLRLQEKGIKLQMQGALMIKRGLTLEEEGLGYLLTGAEIEDKSLGEVRDRFCAVCR